MLIFVVVVFGVMIIGFRCDQVLIMLDLAIVMTMIVIMIMMMAGVLVILRMPMRVPVAIFVVVQGVVKVGKYNFLHEENHDKADQCSALYGGEAGAVGQIMHVLHAVVHLRQQGLIGGGGGGGVVELSKLVKEIITEGIYVSRHIVLFASFGKNMKHACSQEHATV